MEPCYKILHHKNGTINSRCLRCSYWKNAVKGKTSKKCFEYFNCEADCEYRNGKVPTQNRIDKNKKKKFIAKKSDISFDDIAKVLILMMKEEKK